MKAFASGQKNKDTDNERKLALIDSLRKRMGVPNMSDIMLKMMKMMKRRQSKKNVHTHFHENPIKESKQKSHPNLTDR